MRPMTRQAARVITTVAPFIRSRLAMDQSVNLGFLKSLKAETYTEDKPQILRQLQQSTNGKLARDASIKQIAELLDLMDSHGVEEDEAASPEMAKTAERMTKVNAPKMAFGSAGKDEEQDLERPGMGAKAASRRSSSEFNGRLGHEGGGLLSNYEADEDLEDDEDRHELEFENDPDDEEEPGREEFSEAEDDEEEMSPSQKKERLGFKSNARRPERMSHGNTKPYFGGEELKRQGAKTGEDRGRRGAKRGEARDTRYRADGKARDDGPPAFKGMPQRGGGMDAALIRGIRKDARRIGIADGVGTREGYGDIYGVGGRGEFRLTKPALRLAQDARRRPTSIEEFSKRYPGAEKIGQCY